MLALDEQRRNLVEYQLKRRGISDPRVLAAFGVVKRESFLPPHMIEFAYLDQALPIDKGQTISQPYIVALMAQALELNPGDRVLEVGTGSGYAAAILGAIAGQVFTIERHAELAEQAARRLAAEGFANVRVRRGDGTLGWSDAAPFDAIAVAAGGPEAPRALLQQLKIGGRLVLPVGDQRAQKLVRITRLDEDDYQEDDLGEVRFVPLIGEQGWADRVGGAVAPATTRTRPPVVAELVREEAESFGEIDEADLGALLNRIGDSRLVLIGESTHGTSEFYRLRARVTQALIEQRGFQIVAIEGDWPDCARVDEYVRGRQSRLAADWQAFARFPTWMWRNEETSEFIRWLRDHNARRDMPERTSFRGLDLYSIFTSIDAVIGYLNGIDREAAELAKLRYGCLTPWQGDPALYGRLAVSGRYRVCADEAVAMLRDLLQKRLDYAAAGDDALLDAVQNARLVANAERYYRAMYFGGNESWNLRDRHMFDTLELMLSSQGVGAKAVVWEHNSHVGDASFTELGAKGELNVGQLCRARYGNDAYLIGQATDHGTVAAAANWDEPLQVMQVRPGYPGSYENLFHESRVEAFFLPLRHPRRSDLTAELADSRLERAIGVVYRPQTELASHYFEARLSGQFDELIWFDHSQAVRPISQSRARALPAEHPFSLRP